jgi:hypothetical protein
MFILKEKLTFSVEYYIGKTYIVQGDNYPGTVGYPELAKKYTSENRAWNACNKLNEKTGRNFEVVEYMK